MTRSKKIFAAFAFFFLLFLVFIVYDISTRTTFPGTRPATDQSTPMTPVDSVSADSVAH